MLYSRHDFVSGKWPAELRRGVADQEKRFIACLERFALSAFGDVRPDQMRRATFVMAEVPLAATKQHLQRREPPPLIVDELIRGAYVAIVGRGAKSARE